MSKQCFKCGKSKPLSAFYRHPKMADGRLGKCKDCTKADVARHREENLESVQAYDRERGLLEYRKKAVRERYKKDMATAKGRKRYREYAQKWLERNRHKRSVHIVVGNAIKRGLIIPERCSRCGAEKAQAHHEDYSKPFAITWLCEPCHGARHRELNEKNR